VAPRPGGRAVGAAQAGARTLLLEAAGFLGGAATLKCVQTYCGLAGVAAEVIATLRRVREQLAER
jgi:hypothetical protein